MRNGKAVGSTSDLTRSSAVYLCAGPMNHALATLIPTIDLESVGAPTIFPKLGNVDLPCWFANERHVETEATRRVIWVPEKNRRLSSGAEGCYLEAKQQHHIHPGVFQPSSSIVSDTAIFARLTVEDRTIFVIAGIHQFGTWIGGEYLKRLASGEETEYDDLYTGANDFIAIIVGTFDYEKYRVEDCTVRDKFIWTKEKGSWFSRG